MKKNFFVLPVILSLVLALVVLPGIAQAEIYLEVYMGGVQRLAKKC